MTIQTRPASLNYDTVVRIFLSRDGTDDFFTFRSFAQAILRHFLRKTVSLLVFNITLQQSNAYQLNGCLKYSSYLMVLFRFSTTTVAFTTLETVLKEKFEQSVLFFTYVHFDRNEMTAMFQPKATKKRC